MDGWTRKHRKIFDGRLGLDCRLMFLFDYLVSRARYAPGWVKSDLHLDRGQLVTSREELGQVVRRACRFKKPTTKTVWLWLKNLEKGGEVSLQTSSRGTIVTICNYSTYNPQSGENVQPNVQRVYNGCTTDVQRVFTKKKEKKEKKDKEEVYTLSNEAGEIDLVEAERQFVVRWNALEGVAKNRGPQMTDSRRDTFRARMKSPEWREDAQKAFLKFPLKCFDYGKWKPSMEWILRPDTVTEILEAKFDWSKQDGNASTDRRPVQSSGRTRKRTWTPTGLAREESDGGDEGG